MILALDSVFEHCSVALISLSGEVLAENTVVGNRQQTQQILPMIDALFTAQSLRFTDLTAIAFNRGPGAFSGIRINTAVAQALAFAHDLPCLPISSLQALAQQAHHLNRAWDAKNHCYAAIDARMNQIYFGEFHAQVVQTPELKANLPCIMTPSSNEQLYDYGYQTTLNYPVVGNGGQFLHLHAEQKAFMDDTYSRPTAAIIGQLGAYHFAQGQAVSAANALPVYLRHNAWKTLDEQKA